MGFVESYYTVNLKVGGRGITFESKRFVNEDDTIHTGCMDWKSQKHKNIRLCILQGLFLFLSELSINKTVTY